MSSPRTMKGLVLAIEPTDPPGSIALGKDGKIIGHSDLVPDKQFSETFLPLLEALLGDKGGHFTDVAGVVICSGPGSFTGIRVGFSFAYGISQARGVPIYPFPTLDVMAFSSPAGYDHIVPALDARKGEIYTALYRKGPAGITRESDYISISPENLIYKVLSPNSFVFGPGYLRYRELFHNRGFGPFPEEEKYIHVLHARTLLEYFYARDNNESMGPEDVQPIYVRPSEAELKSNRRGI